MTSYHDIQATHQPFEAIKAEQEDRDGELHDLNVSLKDNIVYEGLPTTAGSDILNGYEPSYTADVARFLEDEGATIIGKTKMDAFGFGTYGQNTDNPPLHPDNEALVPGGSSAGSAVLTSLLGDDHVSIAVSTGGSISCPAALCNVTGYTPTNGHVSRHGLIPYADSFDTIGVIAQNTETIKRVEPIITQPTDKDMTQDYDDNEHHIDTVGVPKELDDLAINDDVLHAFHDYIEGLKEQYDVTKISLPTTYEYGIATYYTIATAEASTNLARYDGLRYGEQPEPVGDYHEFASKHRAQQFGDEEKRRVILGTYIRTVGYDDELLERAHTARERIKEEHDDAYDDVDAIITPAMPFAEKTIQEAEQERPAETYAADLLTTPPMLAGLPHLCLPRIPGGLHVITPRHTDKALLDEASHL